MWLWAAVSVGKGHTVYNHENKLKKFTFRLLPRSSDAVDGKPRGVEEIKSTLQQHVLKGSYVVFDKWIPTVKVVKALGFRQAPLVNHSSGFREAESGFHSNDIDPKTLD